MTAGKYPPLADSHELELERLLGPSLRQHQRTLEQLDVSWSRAGEVGEPSRGRVKAEERIRGWGISRDQGLFLHGIIRVLAPSNVLELGGSFGYSTSWITAGLSCAHGIATTVENDQTKLRILKKLSEYTNERLEIVDDDIGNYLRTTSTQFDFVFVDADPAQYGAWAPALRSRLAEGAFVVIDNAISPAELTGPVKTLATVLSLQGCWTIPIGHGMMIGSIP